MRQKVWILLTVCALILFFECTAAMASESGQLNSDISWTLSDAGVLAIQGRGAMPDYSDFNPSPFGSNSKIKSIVFDDRITVIGDRTFMYDANLTSVTLPAGLDTIGYGAFCATGLTEVFIPAGVTAISETAFCNCTALSDVTIMNSVVEPIGDAFEDCASGMVIHGWAGSPTEDYADAMHITFDPVVSGQCGNNAAWTVDPDTGIVTISGTGDLWDYHDYNPSPFWANPLITSVKIEGHIFAVGDRMFMNAPNLTSVSLPAALTSIGYQAFGNTALTEVFIPAGVTVIGESAFCNCENLVNATVMNAVVEINYNTFGNCASGLVIHGWAGSPTEEYANEEEIAFEAILSGQCGDDAVWTLVPGTGAITISGKGELWDYHDYNPSPFWDNPLITSVEIDNRITAVGDRMFMNASNLTSAFLPTALKSIGFAAFSCTALEKIIIPAKATVIGESAFYKCMSLTDATVMNASALINSNNFETCASGLVIRSLSGSSAEEFAAENSIAFEALDKASRQFIFPNHLTAIGSEAFSKVDAWSVVIPQTVTAITGNPFAGSSVLVVFGYSGTAAETFAGSYGYLFVPLDGTGL